LKLLNPILLILRKDVNINEHKRLSNFTHGHKSQQWNKSFIAVQHFTVTDSQYVGSTIMRMT